MRLRLVAIAIAGVVLGAAGVVLLAMNDWAGDRVFNAAFSPVAMWSWIGVGLYAWWRRPHNRFGATMVAVGFVFWLSLVAAANDDLVFSVGMLFSGLFIASVVHMLLAHPSGRLETPAARFMVLAAYGLLAAGNLSLVLVDGDCGCGAGHPDNVLALWHAPGLGQVFYAISEALALGLAIGLITMLTRRLRAASPAQRRSLSPVLTAGMVFVDALALSLFLDLVGLPDWAVQLPDIVALLAFTVLPYTFLVGLARSRWFRAGAVGELVERLNGERRRSLREALADALGDRGLQLITWLARDERYVDETGAPVALDALQGRAVTEVERGGRRIGAIVHDPALLEDAELMQAACAAAALALENERLEAELRARVAELEDSRAKVIEVGLAERRRLERDLHDGAQQRLVALGLQVSMARARLDGDPAGAREILDRARDELREAQEELRELARGIHPAILTDRGLGAAVESLAQRATVPVTVRAVPARRLPPPVEAVAYFVVAESLTNVAKHARAGAAEIRIERVNGHAVVEVADDGVGGAPGCARGAGSVPDGAGSGLRGLADRLAAVDGRLTVHSPPGAGTTIRAEIPCASS
jgi:signal transduction histidine kinase